MIHRAGQIRTPLGPMIAVLQPDGPALEHLHFAKPGDQAVLASETSEPQPWRDLSVRVSDWPDLQTLQDQIDAYFAGQLTVFDVPLAPMGNAFLQRAWTVLRGVPYGVTTTYGALAEKLDPPTVARAMGRANAVNPISIIVPCHRVIGKDGTLTGYAGGLDKKAALLAHEGVSIPATQTELPL